MKFARQCGQLLLLALLSPTVALALGLGDIHLKSTLDAPLDADIDLVDAEAEDLSTLKASLAPRDTFKHFGADYPSFLGTVTLTPERTADGRAVLHVHSASPAAEPFATLLVEVDWSRGHLVREYTLLLDPPVFNSQTPTNANVAAPAAGASAQSGLVEHAPSNSTASAPSTDNSASSGSASNPSDTGSTASANASAGNSEPGANNTSASTASGGSTATAPAAVTSAGTSSASAPPSLASESPASGNSTSTGSTNGTSGNSGASTASSSPGSSGSSRAAPGSYTVRRGDTLSRIADENYGSDSSTRARALVAIYRANPKAFHDNMNTLYSGAVLNLPGDSELEAIGPGEAVAEVRHQYDEWRGEHGGEQVAENTQGTHGARGQLRLVAPQEGGEPAPATSSAPSASSAASSTQGGANAAKGAAANVALQQRVQQLEAQLAESQRLLQLRNAELAALQARVQQQGQNGAARAPAPPAPPAPAVATQPASQPAPAAAPVVPPPVAPSASPPPAPAPVAVATPHPPPPTVSAAARAPIAARAAHPPVKAAQQSGSVVDLLLQYWYVPAALLALLVVALALRWMRTRQEDAFDRSLGELSDVPESPAPAPRTDTVPVRTIAGPRQEPSYRVEESGTHQRPDFSQSVPAAAVQPRQQVAVEEPVPGEAPVALDQGDPLAEADFHMAYGLYDQAAELVQIAITREPKRRDLKLKLLEVFFVWGNRDRFLQTAHDLAGSRDQAPAGEWEKILIMGRQIAPDDPLFTDSRGVAGAGKVVDLNLEGGQNRVDFDLLGEPSLGNAPQDAAVELDLSAALGEPSATEATGEAPQMEASSDVELDLDAPAHNDATGTTREMPEAAGAKTREMSGLRPALSGSGSGSTETMRVVAETEAPTVEQPQLHGGDHGTIRQKIDAAARSGMVSGEQTAELAIDDLGLDLGALESSDEPLTADPDAPTLLAGVDEDTRRMFEGAHTAAESGAAEGSAQRDHEAQAEAADAHGTDVTQRAPAVAGARATGTWMFTDTDFAQISPVAKAAPTQVITQLAQQPQIVEAGATSVALAALRSDGGDLDLDLGSEKGQAGNGVDLDVGAPAAAEGSYADTQKLSGGDALVSDDMSLPDLEPVTLSEVGTKLDLARAYMDMGDPEGARSILSEVMSEGSMSQKQEARRLMDALPG